VSSPLSPGVGSLPGRRPPDTRLRSGTLADLVVLDLRSYRDQQLQPYSDAANPEARDKQAKPQPRNLRG
jgi:phosphodiesterase/alkaline phosphatase D-like protein